MRIGVDIRSLTEGKITGVEVYTINLLQELLKLDSVNQYIFFYSGVNPVTKLFPDFSKKNVMMKKIGLPNRILNFSFRFLNFPKLDQMLGGLDIFFCPRFLFSALTPQCKLVITTHDLSFVHHPQFFSFKQRLWHFMVGDRRASSRADKIIAVSNSTKKDLEELFGVDPKKMEVIYSGLDHAVFNPQPNLPQENDLEKIYLLKRGYILFLGTVEPRKNILGVIDAYEKMRQNYPEKLQLVLAGGLGWLYKKIISRIFHSPYRQDIKLLQTVSEEAKASIYRMAGVFVFPSFYEGFGFPPLEAMACGVPVVAALNSSFPEVLGNACLYAAPYNSESIYQGLEAALTDSELRKLLIQKGMERAAAFQWKTAALQTLRVFEQFK